jgi:N-acetylglucosaminyldiphosphoundecaprenol N-acetyl-beta-D-mannosaminyltransferase
MVERAEDRQRRIADEPLESAPQSIGKLFGISLAPAVMEQAVSSVNEAIFKRRKHHIGVVNAAKVVKMRHDPELRQAVLDSDVIYADGMSVVWASRVLGQVLPERIAGIDLMHEIMAAANTHGYRVYCLGAKPEVLATVCETFSREYPNAVIAGSHDGYFSADEAGDVAAKIRDARADILFVAITSPKKERFMADWAETIDVPVIHGVGGSFDVVAGFVERAPEAWQKSGFEWLYRVKQEPRRLWKRYLVTNVLFAWEVLREFVLVRLFSRESR